MTTGARFAAILRLLAGAALAMGALFVGCKSSGLPAAQNLTSTGTANFSKDIAPILFQHCAPCHHQGGPAPFSLTSYQDAKKRATQISLVTKMRYMPPWLPEPGYGEFFGERRLREDQIHIIERWVEGGAMEGLPSDLPPAPTFHEGWQLGEPDLVVKAPQPYVLPPGGTDIFRNFVLSAPVEKIRYVRAVEILPGSPKVVHHANILIDRSGSARRRDAQDPEVGFAGMEVEFESENFEPESHFLFWKPGTVPYSESEDRTWRLDKDTDLVLNMHLQPSGKPERIQPEIGLYFSDARPTKFPMLLQLEHDGAIDIPPGAKGFVVTDDFSLPVDVEVLGVYPHAHYLGKEVQGFATLPDGSRRWLLRINNWDFNWQAVYRYSTPIFLPKGTILSMRWSYDNSAENVRNPNHPPRRVVAGNRSSDEMAHLWTQVLPRSGSDGRIILQEAIMQHRLEKYPQEFSANFNLGALLQSRGKVEEAVDHFRRALKVKPNDAMALNSLGAALRGLGRLDEAVLQFRQAVKNQPDYLNARFNLGNVLLFLGRPAEAVPHLQEVLRARPDDADAHNAIGSAYGNMGNLSLAAGHFEQALRLNPEHPYAHTNLAYVLARQGKLAGAAAHFEQAVRINPADEDARKGLSLVRSRLAARH